MFVRRWSACVVLALGLSGLSGCIPHRIVWLPDSSGFFFSDGLLCELRDQTARLFHFDMKQNAARCLTEIPSRFTVMPAVSPDGKRVATVRIGRADRALTAQVIILDIDTGRLHETKPVPLGELQKDEGLPWAVAEWSRGGEHLLIAASADYPSLPAIGIHNVKTETLTKLSDLAYDGPRSATQRLDCRRRRRFPRVLPGQVERVSRGQALRHEGVAQPV